MPIRKTTLAACRRSRRIGSGSVSVPNQVHGLGNGSFVIAAGTVLGDRLLDRVQQILIPNRFGQELDRTALHGPNRHRDIGVATDEDNRHAQIGPGQLLLNPHSPDKAAILSALAMIPGLEFSILWGTERETDGEPDG
jgi:hypothetical protein